MLWQIFIAGIIQKLTFVLINITRLYTQLTAPSQPQEKCSSQDSVIHTTQQLILLIKADRLKGYVSNFFVLF